MYKSLTQATSCGKVSNTVKAVAVFQLGVLAQLKALSSVSSTTGNRACWHAPACDCRREQEDPKFKVILSCTAWATWGSLRGMERGAGDAAQL